MLAVGHMSLEEILLTDYITHGLFSELKIFSLALGIWKLHFCFMVFTLAVKSDPI